MPYLLYSLEILSGSHSVYFCFTCKLAILGCNRRGVGSLSDARSRYPDQGGDGVGKRQKLLKIYKRTNKALSVWGCFAWKQATPIPWESP